MNTNHENKKEVDTTIEETETENIFEVFSKENVYFKLRKVLLYKILAIAAIFTLLHLVLPFFGSLIVTAGIYSLIMLTYDSMQEDLTEK